MADRKDGDEGRHAGTLAGGPADATGQLISLVIPVYNEEAVLGLLFARLDEVLGHLDNPVEIIFVNDGSQDGSLALLRTQARTDTRIRIIDLSRNFGHQTAITAGIDAAKGAAVVIMDADLQDPPEVVRDMIAAWQDGFDVVSARRRARPGETWFKRKSAHVYYRLLQRLSPVHIPADIGDFRLISRRVADALKAMPERDRYIRGMISWIGFRQTEVLFTRDVRIAGESKYSLSSMMRLASNGILGFSDVPLRMVFWVGFLISLLAFGAAIFVLLGKILGGAVVPGWASVVILLSFLSGVQLLTLGIVGLYVGRVYNEVKARPLYFAAPEDRAGAHAPLGVELPRNETPEGAEEPCRS